MRRACLLTACLAVLAVSAYAAETPTNVVAEKIHPIRTSEGQSDTAILVVYVVDDAGDPIDEVEVSVLAGGIEISSGASDARGRVLLRLPRAEPVVVRASEVGLVSAEAHGVALRRGGLTAVVLPLEAAEGARGK